MFAVKSAADILKKEVNELRCTEQKLVRQNELIQAPLTALGGTPPPAGCDTSTADAIVAVAAAGGAGGGGGDANNIGNNSKSEVG